MDNHEKENRFFSKSLSVIIKLFPKKIIVPIYNEFICKKEAKRSGICIKKEGNQYKIKKDKKAIILSKSHLVYLKDIILNFDFYFSGVKPIIINEIYTVDYSSPRWHWANGFDAFPILFPSFAEPIITTKQYIEKSELKKGSTIIDLGAYSGLTSILFDIAIPEGGEVIALEADVQNYNACKENIELYEKKCGRKIKLMNAAIWKDDKGINFSSEGNMGSSMINYVGKGRGNYIKIPSLSLSQLAKKFQLSRIDFIKCDIEGAEIEIFNDPDFFLKYSPVIIIECHMIGGELTSSRVIKALSQFDYECELIKQHGSHLPLLFCKPKKN